MRWSMAIGTDLAVENVLSVMNLDFLDGTVTVKALGPGGEVAVSYGSFDRLELLADVTGPVSDTLALRPLAVISIVPQVQRDFGYALTVDDIQQWERAHGRVPAGSVVMVRSDWHKGWNDPEFVARTPFPGVSLAALKFLHLERQILFHGHEPLDTDSTPTLEGESWLLNNGYLQAEGVANLDQVPETGALITIGFPKFKGGTGGLASFVAICPKDWPHGERRGDRPDAPFDKFEQPLAWDATTGTRTRTSG